MRKNILTQAVFVFLSLCVSTVTFAGTSCRFSQDVNQYLVSPDGDQKKHPIEMGLTFSDTVPYATFNIEAKKFFRLKAIVQFEVLQVSDLGTEKSACRFGYQDVVAHTAALLQVTASSAVFSLPTDGVASALKKWAICEETGMSECQEAGDSK